jgi:UDP-N-acetylmuramoylalanine--D-glutamate ligase
VLPKSFKDRRVTIMGLGRFGGGVAVAEYLASQGAQIVITDLRSSEQLADSIQQLSDRNINATWFLGSHPDDAFDQSAIIVVNPAVHPGNDYVDRCRSQGKLITSEIEIFTRNNPALTIAVTGSNGKSTTCQLIHDLLRANVDDARQIWLGGNIGRSLLPDLASIHDSDIVVLELSSFQLHQLQGCEFCPAVAVVTGLTPNHLDWHPDLAHYVSSKQVISACQRMSDAIVVPDDLEPWPIRGRCLRFGLEDSGEDGVYIEDGSLVVRIGENETAERLTVSAALRGNHNLKNIMASVAAVELALDCSPDVQPALQRFRGLPHRMQIVCRSNGRTFIDDSSSTTPESTIAALRSIPSQCVLMAGGGNKGVNLGSLASEIAQHANRVVTMGATAASLASAVLSASAGDAAATVIQATDFPDAFEHAVELSQPGDIVLLSPGCSSHGWFADFRERGHSFTRLANEWHDAQEKNA